MSKDKNGKELPKGIRLRTDGRYEGRFRYAGTDYNVLGKNSKECEQKLSNLRYEVQNGVYCKEENITMDNWFNTWISEYKELSVKTGTVHAYKTTYDNYIKSIMGNRKLKDIRGEHIQKLYNDLYKKEYSKNTLELVSVVLSGMFKQAVKNKIIKENPVPLSTLPKTYKEKECEAMTLEEQQLFMKYAKESKLYDIFELALSTGMRSGELRGLEWSDIDFKNKIIHITGTLVDYNKTFKKDSPKTPSSKRDIPMLDNVYQLLLRHRAEQSDWSILACTEWKPLDGLENLVFTNDSGKPLNRNRLTQELKKILKRIRLSGIDFKAIHPHMFRHTFATRCIESGMQPQVVKAILGHSKLSMTMDLYAHVLPDTKASELQKIAGLFMEVGANLGQNPSKPERDNILHIG